MEKIRDSKINFILTLHVECTDPESVETQKAFDDEVKEMEKYLKAFLLDELNGKWNYTARVNKVNVNIIR